MKNYDRYKNRKGAGKLEGLLSHFLWRLPSDKVILPIIKAIHGKKVCDVGCGAGLYSQVFLKNKNSITGVDKNPQLCTLTIKVYDKDATRFTEAVGEGEYDIVFSGWLTEYLSKAELASFFKQSYRALRKEGTFLTTVILNKGWGWLYIYLAKVIRRIDKYNYSVPDTVQLLKESNFASITEIPLPSWLHIPWACLYICKK